MDLLFSEEIEAIETNLKFYKIGKCIWHILYTIWIYDLKVICAWIIGLLFFTLILF